MTIDLNLDAGESRDALETGNEKKLFDLVSSVNIACGGHAGDEATMAAAVYLAKRRGLRIGAHPSFPDKEGFGRTPPPNLSMQQVTESLTEQIAALKKICDREKVAMTHVKPHGALYHLAAHDEAYAKAIFNAIFKVEPELRVIGLAGSPILEWAEQHNLSSLSEAFCDRTYEDDGTLRSRQYEDAVITDPLKASGQAVRWVKFGEVVSLNGKTIKLLPDTICIHGDTPNALEIAQAVKDALDAAGIAIKPYPLEYF